jgi:hypothetical protein
MRKPWGPGAMSSPPDADQYLGVGVRPGRNPSGGDRIVSLPQVVSRDRWLEARKELLAEEKRLATERGAGSKARRSAVAHLPRPRLRLCELWALGGELHRSDSKGLVKRVGEILVPRVRLRGRPRQQGSSGPPLIPGEVVLDVESLRPRHGVTGHIDILLAGRHSSDRPCSARDQEPAERHATAPDHQTDDRTRQKSTSSAWGPHLHPRFSVPFRLRIRHSRLLACRSCRTA